MENSLNTPRVNVYAYIHKALRSLMCHTLVTVGRTDPTDTTEVDATLAQVRDLTGLFATHLAHENTFLHSAMEARARGSSATTAGDHTHHEVAINNLNALSQAVAQSSGTARADALTRLYRNLALFVAENLTHMEEEESANNAVLWATYTDQELLAIEASIHQAIEPAEMALCMHWMLPGLNAVERAGVLMGIRDHAPEPVFGGMLGIARKTLSTHDFEKVDRALRQPLAA